MIISKFSSFLQIHRNVKCPTSRTDCETNFLSILENFFQSDCILAGKSISAIYNAPTSLYDRRWLRKPFGPKNVWFLQHTLILSANKMELIIIIMRRLHTHQKGGYFPRVQGGQRYGKTCGY